MRAAVVLIALCLPGVAAAGDPYLAHRDFVQSTQAMEARQRDIFIQNELMGIDMRLRTDEALRGAYVVTPAGPIRILPGPANGVTAKVGPFAEIPDASLADSNARVRAASKTKR